MASPFARKVSNESGEEFELPPAGLHPAVLVGLIDLGTHDFEYQGNKTSSRKLFIVWELVAEVDSNGDNFLVAQDYTASLHKKANFRKMLEAWRGREFTTEEEFDPVVLLGQKCIVTLQAGLTKSDKRFIEVVGVASPMKGQAVNEGNCPYYAFHLDDWGNPDQDPPIPSWVPRNYGRLVLDDIKKSKEWDELKRKSGMIPASNTTTATSGNGAKPVTNSSHVGPMPHGQREPVAF